MRTFRGLLLGLLSIAPASLLFSSCSQGVYEPTPQNFTLSGTLSGLIAGQQLSLSLNGALVIAVTANGPFSFPAYLTYYPASYVVVVATQPSGETCTVGNYTGSVTQNVANVTVVCSANNYTVGGTVSGLNSGAQFTLQNNGSNTLSVTSNGSFQFTTPIAFNSSYNVTVSAQPTGQTCTVMNGSGAAIVSNVTNVSVMCSENTFTIGGTLSGLGASDQVTLLDNGGNSLTLTANGPYAFTTPVAYNSGYNVTVGTQPVGQMCSVSNGNGLATVANITNVNVLCSTDTYTIGGAVSGLGTGLQVTLDDNGADPNTVTSNTNFTFVTPIAYGGQYNVTVGTQPTGQTCTVSNASANDVTANVTNVGVLCAENTYTIGGTVSGLSANGLVLKNNAGDPISVTSGSTSFQFDQPIAYGSGYNVTVFQQPTNETCNITNSSGSNVMANVTNVQIGCSVNVPTVTSMSPTAGPIAGGTNVTITGGNFVSGATTVTIGGTTIPAASVTVNSTSSLTFSTPAHAAGNVSVTVTTAGGTSSAVSGGFTYQSVPTITSLSPAFGPTVGGTSVTIAGTNFVSGSTLVTIGSSMVAAASVTVNSATSLTFTTPAASAGNVSVTVTTPGGTSSAVSGGFTYESAPTATSLTPAFGPTAGGTSVTITGTNFVAGNTSVTIGGTTIPAASVIVNSATSLTFSTPAASASNVSVTVSTSGGTSSAVPGGFTYESAPTATSLSPAFGPTAGGTSVTVTGTNFVAGNTSVTIGGTTIPAASVMVNSATSLTFSTPAASASNVSVTVSTSGGTSSAVPGGFTYESAPTATSLSPAFGPTAGGTSVTITGTNFVAGNTSVTIGGTTIPAASVTVNSATSLTFSTPASSSGNVSVTVSTSGGTSSAVSGGFTYESAPTTTSLSPAYGPTAGGTSVTVTGTNFVAGNTSVTIGGTTISAASVTVNSATSLTFSTPAASSGNVSVTVSTSGGASSAVSGGFTYESAPTATSLSPAYGPTAGGTSVTITGTNFVAGNTSVTVGGTTIPAGSVTVNSATSLTFTTPAASAGTVAVTVSTSGGTSSAVPGGFSYQAFTIGGTLTGLASSESVVLQNNGGNNLTLNSNGSFTFTSTFTQGSTYNVMVLTQPAAQTCTVINGAGIVGANNVINVAVICANNTTTMSTSVSSLALSVSGLTEYGISGTPSSGVARTITITNTGFYPATNLSIGYPTWPSGTTASSTCGSSLAATGTCTITITPGATASSDGTNPCTATGTAPVPQTVTISANNATSVTTSVVVLGYGCIYQGGYVFAFDDTTSTAANVGGKVAATSDQSSAIIWSSNGTGGAAFDPIYGISQTSTTASPNPSSGQVIGQTACNGNEDGACDTNNIYVYYQTSATNAPISTSSYAAGVCKATISSYSDWYLPAACELGYGSSASCGSSSTPTLQNMQSNLVDFNSLNLLSGYRWSSTGYSAAPNTFAWGQYFAGSGSSAQSAFSKSIQVGARCVRATN